MPLKTVFTRGFLGVMLLLLTTAPLRAASPVINTISPNRGPVGGGTLVTVSGESLTGTTSVTFDGVAGTSLTIINDNTLTVRTPAHAAGVVDVIVTNADGTTTRNEGFGYGNVPIAADDTFTAVFNTPLQVFPPGILSNDNTNDGGDITAVLVSDVSSGTLALSTDGGFTYTAVAGATGSVTFTYRASNSAGTSNLATVNINIAAPTGPLPPTGLYVSFMDGNNVTLRWTQSPFGILPTSHIVEGGSLPGQVLGTLNTGTGNPIFTFTAPTGTFFLRVRAVAGGLISAPSNEILALVNVPAPPSAPDSLLGLVNGDSLALAWRNTYGGGPPTSIAVDVTGSANTSIPLPLGETFTFAGVPGGTYTFTLRALNGNGSSGPSTPLTLTFPSPCSGPPLTPANFVVFKVGNVINVAWELPASGPAPTGYVLNVSGSIFGTFFTTARQMSGAVGAGAYTLSVTATNPCGASSPTTAQTVTIP
jgi:hypothetical protein